jgi:hypothetical protein
MPKTCLSDGCSYPVFGGGYCKLHQYYRTDKKKPKKINPISSKMIEALKLYKIVRSEFLNRHPLCQAKISGICTKDSTQVHHTAGRIGDLLTDHKYFLAVCHHCHCYIETHPEEAKSNGWSVDRFTKDKPRA